MSRTRPQAAATPAAERARAFWRRALGDGGVTAIPRWTEEPRAGVGAHEVKLPGRLVTRLRRLADALTMPFRAVLLAAHAKVLSALAGEQAVTTGYVVPGGGPPLVCRLTTAPRSWQALLLSTHWAEAALRGYADFPVDDLARELGVAAPPFETVWDPAADEAGALPAGTVLRVGVRTRDGVALRLQFRTDALDAACAARIAGYHRTALARIAADPEGAHDGVSLLSAEELRVQLEDLAGPRRTRPDRRVHELFEARVRAHPDAVAALHGDRSWTYGALNARANRLARALVARGLQREDVVAVVTERHLDWLAAVLAIFKAGGAYLPIEPQSPPERIARMLARAGCRQVLTESGSRANLDRALEASSGIAPLRLDAAEDAGHSEGDLGFAVAPDQLAYIFFTSGSTGEPKGAQCEHAGLVNHLFAKIEDLGIGAADVVAQTAPQGFDISLWQLLAALLVGGRTRLILQPAIMDARRYLDALVAGGVTVVQVVPSYLEVLVAELAQHPRPLPDLRVVCVTGEALKKPLVERWFAVQPGRRLVNAYGLTETSDDTNHHLLDGVPREAVIPLGRPIGNVCVDVVDAHGWPVPLGAPGEIVVSGVCVGRGYVNDPERTRRAFGPDPHRPGQRCYRSGDYGRWRPDGTLAFLGRRDTQVKVSGLRIEIGEIENALASVAGVRDSAVVLAERADRGRHLVAFYAGPRPLAVGGLREELRARLPTYMVPSAFHWRGALPVTANGKTDRQALARLAGAAPAAAPDDEGGAPRTGTERRLAAAWAEVLGIPREQIGRRDHFFDLGGTSLTGLKLVIALDRAVTFRELAAHPVLADQARVLDERGP